MKVVSADGYLRFATSPHASVSILRVHLCGLPWLLFRLAKNPLDCFRSYDSIGSVWLHRRAKGCLGDRRHVPPLLYRDDFFQKRRVEVEQ